MNDKDKQIRQMACAMCGQDKICGDVGVEKCVIYPDYRRQARRLYEKGYRKQREGEWKQMEFWEGGGTWRCTECKRQIMFLHGTPETENMNFCPNCGAKMKDGAD